MITLGIETATAVISVALGDDDGLLASIEVNQGRRHAEVLAPAIEFVCRHTKTAVDGIGAIGVDIGPGLFTGMRVGIATAKVMGQALQIPVVGVCSLDVLAHPLRTSTDEGGPVIACVIDARKGEVFYAFYRSSAEGRQRLTEPRVGGVDDFNADVLGRGQEVIAVGDGAWRYRKDLVPTVAVTGLVHPTAASLVTLARANAVNTEHDRRLAASPDVNPMYLRAPDAAINWSSR